MIDTYAGTGGTEATPDGAAVGGTPLQGPRTLAIAPNGDLFVALREGNMIFRIDVKTQTLHRVAGTGQTGYEGGGGPALDAKLSGPKGLEYGGDALYLADTESNTIRRIDLQSGMISTVLAQLHRPHGVLIRGGLLYVSDSEGHRIVTIATAH